MKRALVWLLISAVGYGQAGIRGFAGTGVAAEQDLEKKARAFPQADLLKLYMRRMASAPHAAGSAGSKAVAEYALGLMKSWGLDAQIEVLEALMPYPTTRLLELTGPTKFRAQLVEPALSADPDTDFKDAIPPYNAYAASGDVTAQMVYVNYGTPEDYDVLESRGISVAGKIVIARYGRVWRGLKPKLAQDHGAAGCLIYSDPRDDGFFVDNAYPDGPMRPEQGVQRGSVMDMALYTGDPLTPGWASEPGAKRLDRSEARTLLKIPVLPISWGDAKPLLDSLEGPLAPEAWRGALPITYHVGPSKVAVHLAVDFDWTTKPLYNVIATIPGGAQKDQWILYGNHHDAWVTGASDPVSGAAALLETARALAEMVRQGWRPNRTVKFALWDGEEFGLLGSTEWVEKHAEELDRAGAVYLNSDSIGAGQMGVGGSPVLETFLNEVLRDVPDPRAGRSILETIRPGVNAGPAASLPLGSLGSGSDYVPFLHHLGIASLNLGFAALPGQYHSSYDTVQFFDEYSDSDRKSGVAMAQVMATALLRLADAEALPFEFESLSRAISRDLDEIRALIPAGLVDLRELQGETVKLTVAARAYETALDAAVKRGGVAADANEAIERTERVLTLPDGLPGREWYRHQIYAPGLLTGYAAKTLPGVREAVEGKRWEEANQQAQRLVQVLRAETAQVERATAALTVAVSGGN